MILAHHVIFCAYGFWLPNDPRGSWSDFVGSWELLRFGPSTKVHIRRSLAHASHNDALRFAAKRALKFPPVSFNGRQAVAVSRGFRQVFDSIAAPVFACSILPEHIHLVVGKIPWPIPYLVNQLKGKATLQLLRHRLHPLNAYRDLEGQPPMPWARSCWKAFLYSSTDIRRATVYVEENPIKESLKPQRWPFTIPYDPACHRVAATATAKPTTLTTPI